MSDPVFNRREELIRRVLSDEKFLPGLTVAASLKLLDRLEKAETLPELERVITDAEKKIKNKSPD